MFSNFILHIDVEEGGKRERERIITKQQSEGKKRGHPNMRAKKLARYGKRERRHERKKTR